MAKPEPKALRRGKQFHRTVQGDWLQTAQGKVYVEKAITKVTRRRGRIDVFVDAGDGLVAVAEVKCSSWDRMSPVALRQNITRQASQIWDYVESQLSAGKEVSPGVIFPPRPRSKRRVVVSEELFENRRIAGVWQGESF